MVRRCDKDRKIHFDSDNGGHLGVNYNQNDDVSVGDYCEEEKHNI